VALGAATKQYVDTQTSASNLPAGAIMAFYRNAAPTGWLECNGQSAAAYPNLVALGIVTVPDLRGEFVRGWDNGKGTDPGRALASSQADALKSHTHTIFGNAGSGGALGFNCSAIVRSDGVNTDGPSGATGGSETRPRNIALMYCIKT
jgi:microcystin-dependent protein